MNRLFLFRLITLAVTILTMSCGGGTRTGNQSAQADNQSNIATAQNGIPPALVGKWYGEDGHLAFEITAEGIYIANDKTYSISIQGDTLRITDGDGDVYWSPQFEIEGHALITHTTVDWGKMTDYFTNAENASTSDERQAVYLKYNQPVNGYRVEAVFMPDSELYEFVIGEAHIKFIDAQGRQFTLTNDYFALPRQQFSDLVKDLDEYVSIVEAGNIASLAQGQTYHLDYKYPKRYNDEPFMLFDDDPFFFEDVTFSGTTQLILTQFGQGQRFSASYQVYAIFPDGQAPALIEFPFTLDGLSTIDHKNKRITIQNSQGADDSFAEVYQINAQGQFYLHETIRE